MPINAKLETENTGVILVTGGTGMLGRFIVPELQRINHLEFFESQMCRPAPENPGFSSSRRITR